MGGANSADRPPPRRPSTPPPPPPLPSLPANHPLPVLLAASALPPTDPDTSFYHVLFSDYVKIGHASSSVLAPLVQEAVRQPTSHHAFALSTSVRAAIFHIRQSTTTTTSTHHGALLFALAVLAHLRRFSASLTDGYLAIAAGPAEAQLAPTDRVDLARSLRTHLIIAVLDLIPSFPVLSTPAATQLLTTALPLLLQALAEEDPRSPPSTSRATTHNDHSPIQTPLLRHYADAARVVIALLDVAALGAPHTHPSTQLFTDVVPPQSSSKSSSLSSSTLHAKSNPTGIAHGDHQNTSKPKTNITLAPASSFIAGAASVWDALDSFTSSTAAAFNAKTGFSDVLSVFGASANNSKRPSPKNIPPPPPVERLHPQLKLSSSPNSNSIRQPPDGGSTNTPPNGHQSDEASTEGRFLGLPVLGPHSDSANVLGDTVHQFDYDTKVLPETRATLGEQALALLGLLCHSTQENEFSNVLCQLRDTNELTTPPLTPRSTRPIENSANTIDEHDTTSLYYPYSRLYDILGHWLPSPRGGLIGFELLVRNKMFRTYALARTDPEVILVPLLATMRARCVLGGVPADVRTATSILLTLSEDKGFCEAVDSVRVPISWVQWIMPDQQQQRIVQGFLQLRVGDDEFRAFRSDHSSDSHSFSRNGSSTDRDRADMGMGNSYEGMHIDGKLARSGDNSSEITVSGAVLAVCGRVVQQSLVVKRKAPDLYVAIECLGIMINIANEATAVDRVVAERVVGLVEFLARRRKRAIAGKESGILVKELGVLIGMSLEVIMGLLTNRPSVAVNRHVVYAVMHRESGVVAQDVASCSVKTQALTHMIGRMISFFADAVVTANGQPVDVGQVFNVIEGNAKWLHRNVFDGVPVVNCRLQQATSGQRRFLTRYALSLALRTLHRDWSSCMHSGDQGKAQNEGQGAIQDDTSGDPLRVSR